MASLEENRPLSAVPDPAPLGLAAFALTTFLLSGANATFIPGGIWIGVALFYGGLVQLLAGMWEFRNRNAFGATAFSSYGGFWLALGSFATLTAVSTGFAGQFTSTADVNNALAWFLIAFAIFNTYMLLFSTRVSMAVMLVFLTLEITEIVLAIGYFRIAHGDSTYWLHVGGWCGVVTAGVAWYTSAAGLVNAMAPRPVLPVGRPMWGSVPAMTRTDMRSTEA
jgi:succinate-acetate transporter protein